MTTAEEEFLHYADCCESLNRAWNILQALQRGRASGPVAYAAFRFALVEYAKPYTRSDGIHRSGRHAYKLPPPALSREDASLHETIMNARNRVLAHSDLTLKDAAVSLARFGGRPSACVIQNLPDALPAIDSIVRLIERTLDVMYREKARLEDALTKNA